MESYRNIESGTHRYQPAPIALNPDYVALDDSSPLDLVREAMDRAKQLRFVHTEGLGDADWATILRHATEDWSGFLGDVNGPVFTEFKRFFDSPEAYLPAAPDRPLAQPHIALFVAFLRILEHARKEINAFPKRHLDHYFREVLRFQAQPAQAAEVFVAFELAENEATTFLPAGTRLLASESEDGQVFETTADLEVSAAQLSQIAGIRTRFVPAGFRRLLEMDAPEGGMAAIRSIIWNHGPKNVLQNPAWVSFETLLADMEDREKRKTFPDAALEVTLDEFRQMMAIDPQKDRPLSAEEAIWFQKWEEMHARFCIRQAHPSESSATLGNAKSLRDKLSAALFNGLSLPDFKGKPVKLEDLYRDTKHPETPADAIAAVAYLRGHLFLEEDEFQFLHDLDQSKQGLPKYPAAILEAVVRKAGSFSSHLLRKQVTQIVPVAEVRKPSKAANDGTAWFPYGSFPLEQGPGTGLESLGLLLSSPVLMLGEGQRTIRLSLTFAPHDFAVLEGLFDLGAPDRRDWWGPFSFHASTEKEWLEVDWRTHAPEFTAASYKVTFELAIPAGAPAITRPGEKFPAPCVVGMDPLLQLRLTPPRPMGVGKEDAFHQLFCQSLQLAQVAITVEVKGIAGFQAENYEGELKTSAPFEPFGTLPGPESAFMIAHPEVCLKPLQSLHLEMEWMDLPANLEEYYDPYFDAMGAVPALPHTPHGQQDIVAAVEMVEGRWGTRLVPENVPFLDASIDIEIKTSIAELAVDRAEIEDLQVPTDWPRYLRLVYRTPWSPNQAYLNAERRHSTALLKASNDYAAAALDYANDPQGSKEGKTHFERMQAATQTMADVSAILLPAPYVPKLKRMTLGYTASIELPLAAWKPQPSHSGRVFHQMPFGHRPLAMGIGSPQSLLPDFHDEGSSFLGFHPLQPGGRLSLLLKVQPGSGNPDTLPPTVQWAYHSTAGWRKLPSYCILRDDTKGLIRTGLLQVALPDDAAAPASEMGSQALWLRVSAVDHCDDLPNWEALHVHAMQAQGRPSPVHPDLTTFLPAGSVTVLAENHPSIAKVTQPYPSQNGRAAEPEDQFYRRVSERLRHKNRAVTAWDLEHICLRRFPSLYAVKTVQAAAELGRKPGELRLIVIPDLRKQGFANPFQPKFGYGELSQMADYMKDRAPHSAQIAVYNPRFRPVVVATTINFRKGMSSATGKYKIQECLKAFLAPWAFDSGTQMSFGGRLYVSQVVDVLQSQPYVEFVGKTRLFVWEADGKYTEAKAADGDLAAYIEVADADVFTSADSHLINEISEETAQNEIWEGISWMVINSDFEVALDPNAPAEAFDEWMGVSWMVIGKDFKVSETKALA